MGLNPVRAGLTAFAREVVLPGGPGTHPKLEPSACRFQLRVARSRIHRWGIFAAEAIPARRRVIEYTGQHIGFRQAYRRRVRAHLYLFRTGTRRYIDGAIGGSGVVAMPITYIFDEEPQRIKAMLQSLEQKEQP